MTTVDDAVEAGARALSEHWRDMHTNGSLDRQRDLAGHAARAMWPILSAGLRELHRTVRVRDWDECYGCGALHCPTMRAIQRIDKELGL